MWNYGSFDEDAFERFLKTKEEWDREHAVSVSEWHEDVYNAGGAELVAYTEFREHIKECTICMLDDLEIQCLVGQRLFEIWSLKQLESMRATLKATGDFNGGDA